MAKIGLKHPVFSPIVTITEGETPTYGTGIILGKMTKADENLNYAEGTLYADDVIAEYASILTGGTITLGVDELPLSKRTVLFGHSSTTAQEITTMYAASDDKSTPGGFGFIKSLMIDGKKKYKVRWYYRVVFRESQESSSTANESITFTDTEIVGTILPVFSSEIGDAVYEDTVFDTETAARTYLDGLAGVPSDATIRSVRPNTRTVVTEDGKEYVTTNPAQTEPQTEPQTDPEEDDDDNR